jgi:hypothetical protein
MLTVTEGSNVSAVANDIDHQSTAASLVISWTACIKIITKKTKKSNKKKREKSKKVKNVTQITKTMKSTQN